MELEYSCSQEPATGPFSEPYESTPHLPKPISTSTYFSHPRLHIPSVLLPFRFSNNILYFSMRATRSSHLILLDMITLQYLAQLFILHILGKFK